MAEDSTARAEMMLWKEAAEMSEDAADEFERTLKAEQAANAAKWAEERARDMDEDRAVFGEDEDDGYRYDDGFRMPRSTAREAWLQTLGLPPYASVDDVKKAYRRLAKETHPDKSPEDAARFRDINDAKVALIGGMFWSLEGGAWRRRRAGW